MTCWIKSTEPVEPFSHTNSDRPVFLALDPGKGEEISTCFINMMIQQILFEYSEDAITDYYACLPLLLTRQSQRRKFLFPMRAGSCQKLFRTGSRTGTI